MASAAGSPGTTMHPWARFGFVPRTPPQQRRQSAATRKASPAGRRGKSRQRQTALSPTRFPDLPRSPDLLRLRPMTDAEQLGFESELELMRDEELWRVEDEKFWREKIEFGSELEQQEALHYLGEINFVSRHDHDTVWNNSVICQCWFRASALKHAALARRKVFAQVASDDPAIRKLDFRHFRCIYGPGAFEVSGQIHLPPGSRCSQDARDMCAALRGNTHVRAVRLGDESWVTPSPPQLTRADAELLESVLPHTNVVEVTDDGDPRVSHTIRRLCFENAVRLLGHNSLAISHFSGLLVDASAMECFAPALLKNRAIPTKPALRGLFLQLAPGTDKSHVLDLAATVMRRSGLLRFTVKATTDENSADEEEKQEWLTYTTSVRYQVPGSAKIPAELQGAWETIEEACAANRAQLKCRRLQRLLLGTLNRSCQQPGSLVDSPLFLSPDICEHVLSFLEGPDCLEYPAKWNGREFAWHETDNDVARAVEEEQKRRAEFRDYQKQAKRRKIESVVQDMVMNQAKVSRGTAAAALQRHGGNMVNALIECGLLERMKLTSLII